MQLNHKRLSKRFNKMASIGATDKGGVERLALTDLDKEARTLLLGWAHNSGLQTRFDDFGNIYIRLEGQDNTRKPIVMGSHLDTVPKGGKYDGVLGVLAGFEILESFNELSIKPDFPIEVAVFTNEEGARFPTPMLGSGAIAGIFTKKHVYEMKDDDGIRFDSELERLGYKGEKNNRLSEFEAFIELHIEQGPILDELQKPLGIVKGIQGLSWHHIQFFGESDHAGTTPLQHRKDPLLSASKSIQRIWEWASNLNDGTLVTFGKISVQPNTINVIPGIASFSLDIRHPEKSTLLRRIDTAKTLIREVALEDDTQSLCEDLSFMPPISFDPFLTDVFKKCSEDKGISYHELHSGAGHDAMYLNKLGPTLMLFTPSLLGKSHCEEEETNWSDIEMAVQILGDGVFELINKKQALNSK
ncbi:M20 family metallo-hydrolase [Guptibacillus hwajinpoensis]|uniref:M20 family metallo-hydrolase n=1 Tax=Guptibacillus hwajinpoensis TaxID=208199 RepID=UPI001CFE7857|nr:M20 family metallo-hydrolase [Pseudalkalibacillus hwajinpoensis]WLR59036.1 M20 family metallo-hydrolase [Pseudalkalibacillus hwajinpoensis]